jgi:hypothetical protein
MTHKYPGKSHMLNITNATKPGTIKCPGCKDRLIIKIDETVAVAVLIAMGYDVSIKRPSPRTLAKRQAKEAAK